MAFAEALRRRRLERFLSQAELGRRAGVHALTITRLEAGASAPSTRTVRALAEALGIEPRELASPHEVAEIRRVVGEARRQADDADDRLESWEGEGGAGSDPSRSRDT